MPTPRWRASNRRWLSTAAILAAIATAPLSTIGARAETVLKVVPYTDLQILDPIVSTSGMTAVHAFMIYETLFSWDADNRAQPQMVGAHSKSADGLTYRLTLRDGLAFHDGRAVAPADVIASLKRWMARDLLGQRLAANLAAIEADGDKTVVLRLKQPYGWVEQSLGSSGGNPPVIMRAEEAATDPSKAVMEAIGSGPFIFSRPDWVQGAKVVYKKNTAYVPRGEAPSNMAGGKVVKVDRVDWLIMPDEQTALSALIAGEVDVVNVPPPDFVPQLKTNPDLVVAPLAPDYIALMRPNHLHPPFNNVKARQALALMVNQQDYLSAAFGGLGKPCFAYFTCASSKPATAGSEAYQKPDLARARQLMIEAGYKGEKIVQIGVSDVFFHNAMAQVTIENLKAIGVNVDPQLASAGVLQARRAKKDAPEAGGYNLFQTSLDTITLSSPLTNIAAGTSCDGRNWPGWPCDEEANRLHAAYIAATDEAAQAKALEALNARLWEVLPYIILGQFERPSAWRKSITGLLRANFPVAWNVEKRG